MSRPFSQTLRSLDADGRRLGAVGALAAVALVAAWLVWFVGSEVTLWVSTDEAALEIDVLPHRVEAPVDGEVTEVVMELDAVVDRGDILLRLRTTEFETALRRAESRRRSLEGERAAVEEELRLRESVLQELRGGVGSRVDEAAAELESARAEARNAREDAERWARLLEQGQVSESEARRRESEAEQMEQSAEALRHRVEILRGDTRLDQGEQGALIAELRRDEAGLQGSLADVDGEISALRDEIELRTIRAPVDGRLAEVMRFVPASVVESGDRLCTVVPAGRLQVRADFAVAKALGRIRQGQKALVRLDGYPWAQFGTLRAEVVRVAGEAREGKLEVFLELDSRPTDSPRPVDLVHGMTGRVEINVEQVSPVELFLRAAGQRLTGS